MSFLSKQLLVAVISLLSCITLSAYPLVHFDQKSQWIQEGWEIEVTITLSERSYLPVEVPFEILATSTADILSEDEDTDEADDDENDYYIIDIDEEDEEDYGYSWDSDTMRGKWIFSPGQTTKTFLITTLDDDTEEENESITIRILADDVTIARPVEPLEYTLLILDDEGENELGISLTATEREVTEGDYIYFSVSMDFYAEEDIELYYTIDFETADENDIDTENSSIIGSFQILEDYASASTTIYLADDMDIEDEEETFVFRIISATGLDTGKDYSIDDDSCTVTIQDNDPTYLSLSLIDDEDNFYSLTEGTTGYITVALTGGPSDLEGNLDEDLEIPVSITGTATEGEDTDEINDSDFYISNDLPLIISAGASYTQLVIYTRNDDHIEGDETITVTLGAPSLADSGTSIPIEGTNEFTITLEDNDPVSINFGKFNESYDADDEDSDEPYFIPTTESLILERTGGITVPIYLSAWTSHDITFDLTLDTAGSTATLYDPDLEDAEEQEWDYSLSADSTTATAAEPTIEVTIPAGYTHTQVTVYLNDDEESQYILGQAAPDDIESDETISFSMSNLVTDSTTAAFGEATSHTITVKELPDLDVTHLFQKIEVDQSNWEDGQPPYNNSTSLHELIFEFQPPAGYDHNLTGYNSYKVVFDLSNFDPDNPDAADNDTLATYPSDPEEDEAFEYYCDLPYILRYPNDYDRKVIREGLEQEDESIFEEDNADIVSYASYILWPLELPILNEDYESDTNQQLYDPSEAFRWDLDFRNGGNSVFPVDRLDLTTYPDSIRVYLSPESMPISTSTGTASQILHLEEEEDGRIFIEASTAYATSIQIQYLDENGEWRYALPWSLEASGNRFYWSDRGPPMTESHPSEVQYRIYRVIQNP